MNLRQERMQNKFSIPELSQAQPIEASVLRDYEFNNSPISKNHEYRIKAVFKYPKTFFGMDAGEANLYTEWKLKNDQ